MTATYDAFDISPVPAPGPDARPPELYRGIYGMPMFITIPTPDLKRSVAFWGEVFGFFELFSVPDRLVHLRRWAFQDVLLVPGELPHHSHLAPTVSFAYLEQQLDAVAEAAARLAPEEATGPTPTPWNSLELRVRTPENLTVVCTAARPFVADSPEAGFLADMGIHAPETP